MHNQIISWNENWILIFISFMVDSFLSLLLHHLLHSWHHHFLSKWIRGSSELIPSYSSSLEGSSLNRERLIFSCSHILFSYYGSSFILCVLFPESAKSNHFLLAHIPWMNESHDLGRPSRWLSQFLHYLLLHPLLQFLLWFERPL